MSYVTTKGILDDVQTLISDNSAALRARMLTWLNNIFQRTAIAFPWNCLLKTASISVTTNAITLPADFREVDSIVVGTVTLTTDDEVVDKDGYLWSGGGTTPIGYTIVGSTLTFVPGTAASTVSLRYIQEVPAYADGTSATLFTQKFSPLFQRGLLDIYYEYDADERIAGKVDIPLNTDLVKNLLVSEVRNKDLLRKHRRYIDAIGASANGAAS